MTSDLETDSLMTAGLSIPRNVLGVLPVPNPSEQIPISDWSKV